MYRKFKMRCPKCGGSYYVEVIKPHKWETCPFACNCGKAYQGRFEEFVEYEVLPNK